MTPSTHAPDSRPSLEEMARIYADTLRLPADGFGAQTHPEYGRSDLIMLKMIKEFGYEATHMAIREAVNRTDIEP